MHTEIVRGLGIRYAPLLDQPHRLKLELACKLPSLHDPPPVPLKHLTRCLRNRVQARRPLHHASRGPPPPLSRVRISALVLAARLRARVWKTLSREARRPDR